MNDMVGLFDEWIEKSSSCTMMKYAHISEYTAYSEEFLLKENFQENSIKNLEQNILCIPRNCYQ